jgi:hypothetical protein
LLLGAVLSGAWSCSSTASARRCCPSSGSDEDCAEVADTCDAGDESSIKNVFKNARHFGAIVSEARTTRDVDLVFRHLEKYHGIDPRLASERLHQIKARNGLPGNADLIFDMTGNVYSPNTLESLGSLTEEGAKIIR